MIQVDELEMSYDGHPLFKDASFTIQDGERCGLVGRNGSGKSTLFRMLSGKEKPDGGRVSTKKNYRIGLLDQHIHFTAPTVLEEGARGLREEDEGMLYKVEAILFGLGFKEEDLYRAPTEFSGGYQLRLHLAKVLINEPDCLLLDEPTNYLDIVSIRWFTKFLQQWKGEFILITHDREFMDSVTTHTMGIHRQKVKKMKGSTVDFFTQILLEEEVYEKTRISLDKKRAHAQSFVDRFGAKASKAAQAGARKKMISRIPTLEKLKGIYNLDFNFNELPFNAQVMLDAKNIHFSYTDQSLIQDLNLTIEKGERVAIIGKNGRGKSTILRLLAKDLEPKEGILKISENASIGYFGQTNIDRLHPKHTVEEEIAAANPKLNLTQVKGICGLVMFSGDKSEKPTSVLSGGERSRVLLGKILASPCNLLLLDEPTHHLDMESIEALIDALEDFEGGVIIVTHSELILKRLGLDKIIICREGEQELFLGSYDDFLDRNGWHEEGDAKPKKKQQGNEREQRALDVQSRAAAIKPIQDEIVQKEKLLMKLEEDQDKAQRDLLHATQAGNSLSIQQVSKKIANRKKDIDQIYNDLEILIKKKEEINLKFM